MSAHIRPLAICLYTHAHKILVAEYFDPVKAEKFYRPIGGGIEFGEYAADAVARETWEELSARAANVRYLFTLENLFVFKGEQGHEIVLVFDGEFQDHSLYAREYLQGQEIVQGRETTVPFRAYWKTLTELRTGPYPLYPDGLAQRLGEL
ncbi:MAG: hypothetical protein B6D41_17370 [Chloroflexi bacterium UTCFX4]|jgi:8-oxo-dGTP pyrophosphatase MutT (NUDIX family)|nr:MAG: hypothetical protein B6D41_17370 [Chloroflexi bacterium UTCFX4]